MTKRTRSPRRRAPRRLREALISLLALAGVLTCAGTGDAQPLPAPSPPAAPSAVGGPASGPVPAPLPGLNPAGQPGPGQPLPVATSPGFGTSAPQPVPLGTPPPPAFGGTGFQPPQPAPPRRPPLGGRGLHPPPPAFGVPVPAIPRFKFNIDPKAPVKSLLPAAPRATGQGGPLLSDNLRDVPEVSFEHTAAKGVTG